jgi:hypothetical protein
MNLPAELFKQTNVESIRQTCEQVTRVSGVYRVA